MNRLIQQFVGLFFDSLPYSEEAMHAKAKIEESLSEKEDTLDVETRRRTTAAMQSWPRSRAARRRTP